MLKKITSFLTLSALLLSTSLSFAADNKCLSDRTDPYSAGVTMPAGPYKGQCIDTQSKRASVILKYDETGILMANFRHQNKFWNAWIPANSVESVEFVFVDLDIKKLAAVGINVFHTFLRFHLKKDSPFILKSQFNPHNSQAVNAVDDVMISMNFMAPTGVTYNPIKGLDSDEYLSAIQISSVQDEFNLRFVTQKKNVYGIKLNMTADQAWRTFLTGLLHSQNKQYTVPYQTWNSNCTLEDFSILDQTLFSEYGKKVQPFQFLPWQIRDANFTPSLAALQERGLIKSASDVKLINAEFGYPKFP